MFLDAGINLVKGLINGIKSMASKVATEAGNLAKSAYESAKSVLGIKSPSRAFMAIGNYIGEGLANGIRESAMLSIDATSDVAENIIKTAKGKLEDIETLVENAKYFNELGTADELKIYESLLSQYKEGSEERLKIEKKLYSIYQELQEEDYQNSIDWIEKKKFYNELSTEEELAAYLRIQERYIEGTEEREKVDREIYTLKNQLADEAYQRSMDWIENEKYYNRLSLEEELAAYERVQERYEEGSEEYIKMAKEIYRVKNELASESYQKSMDWIEDEKYYGRLALADELAAYKRVQQRYEEGTEERKKLDKEVYDLEKQIYEAVKSYQQSIIDIQQDAAEQREQLTKEYYQNVQDIQEEANEKRTQLEEDYYDKVDEINEKLESDIQDLEDAYEDALESRTKALYNAYSLFDEVSEKEEVDGATLMQNLKDQIEEFNDWESNMSSLAAKGVDTGLIEELQEMGPSAIAQIKALNNMSDSELAEYVTLWSDKYNAAKERATAELVDTKTETQTQIEALNATAEEELAEYKATWKSDLAEVNKNASKKLAELKSEFDSNLSDVNTNAEEQLAQLREEFGTSMGLIKTDTETELNDMVETAKKILAEAGWSEMGENISKGLAEGIENGKSVAFTAITGLSEGLAGITQNLNDINSPSKLYAKFGRYIDEGLAIGIEDYGDDVVDSGIGVVENLKNTVSNAISKMSDIIDGDMDIEPTITPVIDLSDVVNGIDIIDDTISAKRSLLLGLNTNVNNQNDKIAQMEEIVGKLQVANESSNGKIISAIENLGGDISTLLNRIGQLKVVMNSGALVGEIANDMDSALGGIAKLNRRRVR